MLPGQSAASPPLLAVCLSLFACGAAALQGQDRPSRAQLPQDHDGRGALAILRRDGILFPFAAFNRDAWRVTWPIRIQSTEIPTTADGIPQQWWGTRSPNQWRAYLANGDDTYLELKGPTTFRSFCGSMLGVRTTYQSREPLPPVPIDPFPKDGLAISGGVPLEPIETVSPESPEWAVDGVVAGRRVQRRRGKNHQKRAARCTLASSDTRGCEAKDGRAPRVVVSRSVRRRLDDVVRRSRSPVSAAA